MKVLIVMYCIGFFASSCIVNKRHYRKGFYISTSHRINNRTPPVKPPSPIPPLPVKRAAADLAGNPGSLMSARSAVKVSPGPEATAGHKTKPKRRHYGMISVTSADLAREEAARPAETGRSAEPGTSKINVLALLSFITGLFFFLLVPAVPAVLLGAISIRQMRRTPELYKGRWLGTAGVVLGFIGCAIALLYALLLLLWGGSQFYLLVLGIMAVMIISAILLFV